MSMVVPRHMEVTVAVDHNTDRVVGICYVARKSGFFHFPGSRIQFSFREHY